MDVSSQFFGFSKALYSTWIFYKADNLLIDCGEGAATALGNGVFAVERVLLTHGHIDHISGLPALLWSRAAGMGANEKPLLIYHPKGDAFVADMQAYLRRTSSRLPFDVQWIPLGEGDSIELNSNRRVATLRTQHMAGRLTLAYAIKERRRRLKPEFAGLAQSEIQAMARSGGAQATAGLAEEYEATLVLFGGDGMPLPVEAAAGCCLLFHEATILDPGDRKHQLHSTLEEAMTVAAEARPLALVLYHVSGRYRARDIEDAAAEAKLRLQLEMPVWCLFRERLWRLV